MALKFIRTPQYTYQGITLEAIDTVLNRSQRRYDMTVAEQEAALQEALSRGFVDEQAREDYLNRSRGAFQQVAQKYKGDLSAGRDEILQAVTGVRTDPYLQANQAQLEAYKQQQAALTQLGQYGYVDPKYDISQQSLIDPETGKYRTTFQPRVTDIREFDKIGVMAGQAYAKSNMRDERNLAGYIDRVQGFKTPEEAASFVNSNPDYITSLMQQQGLDPNNEMFRRRVEQGFINSSVGGVKPIADRSLDMELKRQQLENLKAKAKENAGKSKDPLSSFRSKLFESGRVSAKPDITREDLKLYESVKNDPDKVKQLNLSKQQMNYLDRLSKQRDEEVIKTFGENTYKEYTDAKTNLETQIKNIEKKDSKLADIFKEEIKAGESIPTSPSEIELSNPDFYKRLLKEGYIEKDYSTGTMFPKYKIRDDIQNTIEQYNGVINKYNKVWNKVNEVEDNLFTQDAPAYDFKSGFSEENKEVLGFLNEQSDKLFEGNTRLKNQAEEGKFLKDGKLDLENVTGFDILKGEDQRKPQVQLRNKNNEVLTLSFDYDDPILEQIATITNDLTLTLPNYTSLTPSKGEQVTGLDVKTYPMTPNEIHRKVSPEEQFLYSNIVIEGGEDGYNLKIKDEDGNLSETLMTVDNFNEYARTFANKDKMKRFLFDVIEQDKTPKERKQDAAVVLSKLMRQ